MNLRFVATIALGFLIVGCSGNTENPEASNTENLTDTTSVDTIEVAKINFAEFKSKCAELPVENLSSLDSLLQWYKFNKSEFSQDEKDEACLMYIEQMEGFSQTVYGEYDQEKEFKEQYNPYGFTVGGGEGELWIMINTESVVANHFDGDLSKDLREYMRLGEVTGKQYSNDGGLLIGFAELGEILIDLEDRVRDNKDSKYYDEFLKTYKMFLYWMMWGQENTPTINYERTGFDAGIKDHYTKLIDDEAHRTGEIIRRHWHSLEAGNGFGDPMDIQWNPELEEIEHILFDELEEWE